MARPKIEWSAKDWQTFEGMCGIQCSQAEICDVLNIDHKTLDRLCKERYKDENGEPMSFSQAYKKHLGNGKISIRRAQYKLGVEKLHAGMLIWLGRQYLGQSETPMEPISEVKDDPITASLREAFDNVVGKAD